MPSTITKVEVIPIVCPEQRPDDIDGTLDTLIVKVHDDEGRYGFGEADVPPLVGRSFLEMPTTQLWCRNTEEVLQGQDPLEMVALWDRLYEGTFWHGRRGIAIQAISAVDVALYDLVGKQLNVPTYKVMGGARREKLTPYCTAFTGLPRGRSVSDMMRALGAQIETAKELGFRSIKVEPVFGDLVSDREFVEKIKEIRDIIGDDIQMSIDFCYRWHNWHDALYVLDRIKDCDVYFAEATLQHDDLEGHARLSDRSSIRICGAEAAATRFEIREWLDVGRVDVVQPNPSRAGGLTELKRITDMCELRGMEVIPAGWKTGITAAVGRHLQAACASVPLFEYNSPKVSDSPLRRELVPTEPTLQDGYMSLPTGPGLGIELNEELIARWRVD